MTATIAITGSAGFFGWHLRSRLHADGTFDDVRLIDRATFADDHALTTALRGADLVVHLAGATRGPDADVQSTNVALATRLVTALEAAGDPNQLIFANSTQSQSQSAYGESKRQSAEILGRWGTAHDVTVSDLLFPNLFGECGQPRYNSAVATFCDDLANDRDSEVNPDGKTELLHVQDAVEVILDTWRDRRAGAMRVAGAPLAIADVYGRLARLRCGYDAHQLPELHDRLDLQLFNALRTAMFPLQYPMPLAPHSDPRGSFVELARGFGATQSSFSTTRPGFTRGEHYHFEKIERFVVLSGQGEIKLRKLLSEEIFTFPVVAEAPVAIDMPPLFVHNITNTGESDLLTTFWANDHFDPALPDTYPEPVEHGRTVEIT